MVRSDGTLVFQGENPDSRIWVHDGKVTKHLYTKRGKKGNLINRSFFIEHSKLSAELGPDFTNPMQAPELLDEMMEFPLTVTEEALAGVPFLAIRTDGIMPLSHLHSASITMYVRPSLLLIERLEATLFQNGVDEDFEKYTVDITLDVAYQMDESVFATTSDSDFFKLDIPDDARDLTALVEKHAQKKLQMKSP